MVVKHFVIDCQSTSVERSYLWELLQYMHYSIHVYINYTGGTVCAQVFNPDLNRIHLYLSVCLSVCLSVRDHFHIEVQNYGILYPLI